MNIELITNEQLYKSVIEPISKAKSFVWIGTADLKDLHVSFRGKTRSFLAVIDYLIKKNVSVRLLHAKEPGENFRKSFDQYPQIWEYLERLLCPRVHFKHIIIDGKFAYTGSANLTGAGLGMKSPQTRNFESGIITTNPDFILAIINQFEEVWQGKKCKSCKRRKYCADPIL